MAKTLACPECRSKEVGRSHRRGPADSLKYRFLGLQPYRCDNCQHRFSVRPSGIRHLPWLGILSLAVLLAAAWFFYGPVVSRPPALTPPGGKGATPPAAGTEAKSPDSPEAAGPEAKSKLAPQAERMLKALEKAAPPSPTPPNPPPPRSSVQVPPVRYGYVVVPALVGFPKSYAQWVLAQRKLKYAGLLHGPAKGKPHDQVFAQDPDPGAVVPEGTEVKVRSYVAPPEERAKIKRRIPDLKGLFQDVAEDLLRRSGLVPRFTRASVKDPRWHGLVAGQDPPAGKEMDEGSTVMVRLFDAATPQEMPFLVGLPLSYARWLLPRLGLPYKVFVHGPAPGKPHDQVFDQQPVPGSVVPQGLLVHLHVYQAPPKERKKPEVQVPDVQGYSYLLAEDALRRLELVPAYRLVPTLDPANYGLVIQQEPQPGATQEPGKQVLMTMLGPNKEKVGRGRRVPLLVGMPLSYARWALAQQNLRWEETLAGPAKGKPHLTVFQQSPPPGLPVPAGATVKIKAYKAPPEEASQQKAVVPGLIGLDRALAEEVVRKADLIPRFAYVPNLDPRWRGLAESQDPPAEQKVLPGSEVVVRLNK